MKNCSLLSSSSPFLSPNVSTLLKIKILSWSQETGFPLCIRVLIADTIFNLHKHPLTSKSGYFREKLSDSNEVELPLNFPGGPETFQMIALFIYGSPTLVDPFNVASLRCAAEFLQMTDEYVPGNLCERFDIYLNQVVLQNWDDTLIVLQNCQTLLPLAEKLLIVSRCIETLAFMACMEILDPERRRDHPVVTLEALGRCRNWSDRTVKDNFTIDLWVKDLIALPLAFFQRIIASLRRQGMKEKYVSPIIIFYADKWVLLKNHHHSNDSISNLSTILGGIIDLLPIGVKTCKGMPIGFYFSMLSTSLELGLRNESAVEKLQNQIASVLHLSQIEDFLLPKEGGTELSIMESIFSTYFSCNMDSDQTPLANIYIVAELWDMYLNQVASDSEMGCKRFTSLIEIVPISGRKTHDHLYRALTTFFLCHPHLSQEEKGWVCKYLSCQKLSQQVCIEAVQNELMPLRLIVQALFVQQLNTQQVFKDSFRYTHGHGGEYSGSLSSSSRYANSFTTQTLEGVDNSPYIIKSEGGCSRPLSIFLQKDLPIQRPPHHGFSCEDISRTEEYESTSFRIQNLENELKSLKRNLESKQVPKKNKESATRKAMEGVSYGLVQRRMNTKKNVIGQQVSGCIGTVNFASQRKYVNRLFNVLRRISLFGRGRSKRKMPA